LQRPVLTILLLSLLMPLHVQGQQQDYLISRVDHTQLFKRNIFDITQDSTGFMWFAAESGLLRYDGNDVIAYRENPADPNALPSDVVQSLKVDSSGTLWVGTRFGGLSRFNSQTNDFTTFHPRPDTTNDVRAISLGRSQSLWLSVAFDPHIYRFDIPSETFTAIPLPPQLDNGLLFAFDIHEADNGNLWVATVDNGLLLLSPDGELINEFNTTTPAGSRLTGNSLRRIVPDHHGHIWIGGFGAYLSRLNPATGQIVSPDPRFEAAFSNVYDLWIDPREDVIWAAADGGLIRLDLHTLEIIERYGFDPDTPRSLINDRTRAVHHDRSGIIWVGNEHGGIHNLLQRNEFTHVTPNPDEPGYLQEAFVRGFYQPEDDVIWVINSSQIAEVDIETNRVLRLVEILGEKQASVGYTTIKDDPAGGILIGTWGNGLIHYDRRTGRQTQFTSGRAANTLSDDRIQFIEIDSRGRYWIGTQNGVNLFNRNTGTFERILYDFDAPESSFSYSVQTNAFVEDENQVYWIGTWDGLVRFDYTNRTERRYKFSANNAEGLGSNHILSLYDDDTYLWIGTFSGGLNRMHKETGEITRFTDAQGLASNVIFTIIPGNNGDLWLSSNNGVIRFNSVTGSYRNFSESDGLGINDFWWGAGFRSRQGHLYFGSIYGYVTFDPDRIRESRFHPRVVLSEIRVFGESLTRSDILELRHTQNYLDFSYASLDYTSPSKIEYMHMLEGLDSDWIYTGNRSQVSYSALSPGEYVFRVRATNADGLWSDNELEVRFTILPPIWQTMPFRFLMVFISVALIGITIRWRTASVTRQNKQLEALVAERTRDLADSKEELLESNEQLREKTLRLEERNREIEIQRNLVLTNSNELEAKNRQLIQLNQEKNSLIGIVAHDLRSPLASVMSGLHILKISDDMPIGEQLEILDMIETSVNKQLSMITRILDHQALESGKININMTPVDLNPLLENIRQTHMSPAAGKSIGLTITKPDTLPAVHADDSLLEQVLDNMVSNAIKFSPANTTVTVLVLVTRDDIRIGVRDQGPGISQADQEKLFRKFQKLSARPTGGEQSTGLGLSIVKQFAEAMHGAVWCESKLGEGATFWISLRPAINRP